MASKKKMTEKQKREARNAYSRKWKKAHAKQVKQWNKEWRDAQKKVKKGHKAKGSKRKGNLKLVKKAA